MHIKRKYVFYSKPWEKLQGGYVIIFLKLWSMVFILLLTWWISPSNNIIKCYQDAHTLKKWLAGVMRLRNMKKSTNITTRNVVFRSSNGPLKNIYIETCMCNVCCNHMNISVLDILNSLYDHVLLWESG